MKVRTCCPHDCFDACGVIAEVEGGRVVRISGAPDHDITSGFLCGKVFRFLEKQYSDQRILHPMKREGSTFRRIGWKEALDTAAGKLLEARRLAGARSVLTYTDAGSMGYLKSLDTRFWHFFGGATVASGSLCSAAGLSALASDCGEVGQHDPCDIPNSRLIILWGRNPMVTNIHMVPLIRKAKENGAKVILINPMPSESAPLADRIVLPRPGSDAALALGMAGEIIRNGWHDARFLEQKCEGSESFMKEALGWSLERVAEVTGLEPSEIGSLAEEYARTRPASIWLGLGMQRHAGGGNAIRAVNALGAAAGHIGIRGGGVNYANRASRKLNKLGEFSEGDDVRTVWKGTLAEDLEGLTGGPVLAAFTARCNPLLQAADSMKLRSQFDRIPFKLAVEHFMTDTAKAADIVLPAATFLEEDEIYYSYFHNYVALARRAVEPLGEAKPDLEIISALAERMGFGGEFSRTALEWAEYALEPMRGYGIGFDRFLADCWVRFPAAEVPWEGGRFRTESGRMRIGVPEPPRYIAPKEIPDGQMPFYLLTGAHRDRLHSQYDNIQRTDAATTPEVFMHPDAAKANGLAEGQKVSVFTRHGSMVFSLRFDSLMRGDLLYAHHGRWTGRGGGINNLTKGYLADMGGQGALYDCAAGIRPAEVLR